MKINEDTKTVAFEGEIRWATIPPNKPRGPTGKYLKSDNANNKSYSIEVECTEKELKELHKFNIPPKTKLRVDEATGKTYLKINALKVKTNKDPKKNHGLDYIFKDPAVVDKDGKIVKTAAANGSTADVRAKLIENDGEHSLRLIGVRFLELIPYSYNPFSDVLPTIEHAESDETTIADDESVHLVEQDDDDVPY